MGYFEFCCRNGGNNLNSGTRKGDSVEPGLSPLFQYNNGNWDTATGVFTVTAGNPLADGVEVGDVASVYGNGATIAGLLGVVTARDATTITISTTNRTGTQANLVGNGNLRIGGAFAGPDGSTSFPISIAGGTLVSANGDYMRINLKNDKTYVKTGVLGQTNGALVTLQGYTNTYGDLGRATINFGIVNGSLITMGQAACTCCDLIIVSTNTSGSPTAINVTSNRCTIRRVTAVGLRGNGIFVGTSHCTLEECELYNCAQISGTAAIAFSGTGTGGIVDSCIVHTTGTGAHGISIISGSFPVVMNTVVVNAGGFGINFTASSSVLFLINCDIYNSVSNGINFSNSPGASRVYIKNCNFIKNGGWAIGSSQTSLAAVGIVVNCGFGRGTQANLSGDVQAIGGLVGLDNINPVIYPNDVTPWVNPVAGDFRTNLAQAKQAGRGFFMQSQGGLGGTIGYPDIGAAQAIETPGSGSSIQPSISAWIH